MTRNFTTNNNSKKIGKMHNTLPITIFSKPGLSTKVVEQDILSGNTEAVKHIYNS